MNSKPVMMGSVPTSRRMSRPPSAVNIWTCGLKDRSKTAVGQADVDDHSTHIQFRSLVRVLHLDLCSEKVVKTR
jgi:hypothetical protein